MGGGGKETFFRGPHPKKGPLREYTVYAYMAFLYCVYTICVFVDFSWEGEPSQLRDLVSGQ